MLSPTHYTKVSFSMENICTQKFSRKMHNFLVETTQLFCTSSSKVTMMKGSVLVVVQKQQECPVSTSFCTANYQWPLFATTGTTNILFSRLKICYSTKETFAHLEEFQHLQNYITDRPVSEVALAFSHEWEQRRLRLCSKKEELIEKDSPSNVGSSSECKRCRPPLK